MNFVEYVRGLPTAIQLSEGATFILGNSSADYDSIIGSLIYAFLMTSIMKTQYIPLIDCKRVDLGLRFEVSYILQRIGIKEEDLLFFDEVSLPETTPFILYDHNERTQDLKVIKVVDHHDMKQVDENKHLIYPTGSGLTLLWMMANPEMLLRFETRAEIIQQVQIRKLQLLSDKLRKFYNTSSLINHPLYSFKNYDPIIDELLRYGILLDSIGFSQINTQRWMYYDKFAVEMIEKRTNQNNMPPHITFTQLQKIKFDENKAAKLTLDNHLKKDYKNYLYKFNSQYHESDQDSDQRCLIHYSTVYMNPEKFFKQYKSPNNFHHEIIKKIDDISKLNMRNILTVRDCAYLLLFSYKSEREIPKRQVFYFAERKQHSQKINQVLNTISLSQILHEKTIEFPSTDSSWVPEQNWSHWKDVSGTLSRKTITKAMNHRL